MGGPHAKSRPHLLRDMPPFTRERSPPSLKMRRYKKDRPPKQIPRLTSPNHSPQDLHRPKTPHDDSAAHVPHSHWSHVLVVVPWSYPVLFFFLLRDCLFCLVIECIPLTFSRRKVFSFFFLRSSFSRVYLYSKGTFSIYSKASLDFSAIPHQITNRLVFSDSVRNSSSSLA